MGKIISKEKQAGVEKRGRLKKKLVPLFTLLLVVAIMVGIHLVYGRHPERLVALENYVYWGAFLVSVIGNATIILPGAVLGILSEIGVFLYPSTGPLGPILVGLAGGAGAAIGEITGYMAGYSGRGMVKNSQLYGRVEGWMKRWGAITIFIFSVVPFVFDLVGLAAGVLRFRFWKFLLLCGLGRSLLYVVFILLAALGFKTLLTYIS